MLRVGDRINYLKRFTREVIVNWGCRGGMENALGLELNVESEHLK